MKKLPSLYTNTFNKKIDNSQEFITIKNKSNEERKKNKYEITKKIEKIFKSTNYIYKIKVIITFENEVTNETIIGKKGDYLITIDNKLININNIINIEKED